MAQAIIGGGDASGRLYNVLFVCTGNSARSIMAEAILRRRGAGRFRAFSAGSQPAKAVHPLALEQIAAHECSSETLRCKSWQEFAKPDAPDLDFIFTVCDRAAGEMCPAWRGMPITAHWGVADPVVAGEATAFARAFDQLDRRIKAFIWLPFDKLDAIALEISLKKIGEGESPAPLA